MKLAGRSVSAGTKALVLVEVATQTDGSRLRVPIHVVSGAKRGPTLTLVGGLHGDESLIVEVFADLLRLLEPKRLVGNVVMVPTANPLALGSMTRNTPVDMLDLNRNFPGSAGGWLTEKIANVLTEEIIKQSDYFIDFHTAPPFQAVDYCIANLQGKTGKENLRLVRAFGQKFVYSTLGYRGSMSVQAGSLGVPSLLTETGDSGRITEDYTQDITSRIKSVMTELQMVSGEVRRRIEHLAFDAEGYGNLRPTHGGILQPSLKLSLGATLGERAVLGQVISPYTFDRLEQIRSPFRKSAVLLVRHRSVVRPGDYCFMVADYGRMKKI